MQKDYTPPGSWQAAAQQAAGDAVFLHHHGNEARHCVRLPQAISNQITEGKENIAGDASADIQSAAAVWMLDQIANACPDR
jgi:hypothetical protein